MQTPLIGVSQCLLGSAVRYDGDHKYNALIVEQLSSCLSLSPVCPEVMAGFGVPRPPIRLVRDATGSVGACLVAPPCDDLSAELVTVADDLIGQAADWCGLILKSGSPSCGYRDTRVFDGQGNECSTTGTGVFAARFVENLPGLPLVTEVALTDPVRRDQFLRQVFFRHRWIMASAAGWTAQGLASFHDDNGLLAMAADAGIYRRLESLVALSKESAIGDAADRYRATMFAALNHPMTREGVLRALEFSGAVDRERLERYRQGTASQRVTLQSLALDVDPSLPGSGKGRNLMAPYPVKLMVI